MKDSWCSEIWDGTQFLYGAAAREYRLRMAGGVENVIRNTSRKAAENATREALETVNGTIQAVTAPNSNVIASSRPASSRRRPRARRTEQAQDQK
jgi:hypothetical protein